MTTPTNKNLAQAMNVTTWEIDAASSRVEFSARIRLMFLANVTVLGRFSDVRGTLTGNESEPTNAQVNVRIGATSLDTKSTARDTHLRSADFFDVEHYPTLTFISQHIEALDPAQGHYQVSGLLTIRDVAREVTLDAWHVTQPIEAGELRRAFNLSAVFNRRDFGLVWSRPMQKIADEVKITLHVELVPASETPDMSSK